MKSQSLFAILLILSLLIFNQETSGQPKPANNIKILINGRAWIPENSISLGEQYFGERMNLKGSFLYDGQRFENVEFSYDLSREIIITSIETEEKHKRSIIVNSSFLEGFNVNSSPNKFEFLRGGLIHNELDSLGYYQVVKSQNLLLVIKRKYRKKLIQDPINKFNYSTKYINQNSIYIVKEGDLITVRSKKDILELFPDQKKEMKRFIRNNKLKIRASRPMDAIQLFQKNDL